MKSAELPLFSNGETASQVCDHPVVSDTVSGVSQESSGRLPSLMTSDRFPDSSESGDVLSHLKIRSPSPCSSVHTARVALEENRTLTYSSAGASGSLIGSSIIQLDPTTPNPKIRYMIFLNFIGAFVSLSLALEEQVGVVAVRRVSAYAQDSLQNGFNYDYLR